jgi:tetratricopeptide (TPR) repeat protein
VNIVIMRRWLCLLLVGLSMTAMSAQGAESDTAMTDPQYASAYKQFRLLQEAVLTKRDGDAKRAGDACVTMLDTLIQRQPRSFEALALQSACYGYLANLGGMAAIRNGSRSGKSIEAALALAPKNPRVILVDGFGLYFRPKFVGGDKGKGCARIKEATKAFDSLNTSGAASASALDWGAAEAHYWSGRCARDAGDAAMARAEFEKALVLDPNLAVAKKALGR